MRTLKVPSMSSTRVCIIGAGFAGAACAYFLTRAGVRDVVVLEQEEQPGEHASGNNAAMARQFILDPDIQAMAIRGTQFLYQPPDEVSVRPLIRAIGSLILFDAASEQSMRQAVAAGHARGLPSTVIQRAECEARVPVLSGADFSGAIWTPTDGVVDTHAYLHGLLAAAQARGAHVVTRAMVRAIRRVDGGVEVATASGTWQCQVLVNAAGAWADGIAEAAGVAPRGLQALRRHLFQSILMPTVDPGWPFVWDNTHEYYFRPESGGLVLCACDETPFAPGIARVDPSTVQQLAEKLARHCPQLADIRVAKTWAGLRTFAPDRKFVIGWDIAAPSFYWLAGLGGHGVTCAAAVGEKAAAEILTRVG